jgi:hypothetical protein
MSVYYVHAPDAGLVKIGFAKNPQSRFSKMQVDSPTRLVLLAFEDGGPETERARHEQFRSLRRRGEWFSHEGALADHIASLTPFVKPERSRYVSDLAEKAGISKGHASMVLRGKWPCSPRVALDLERASGGEISASVLSPVIRLARETR